MKHITAIIQPHRLEHVERALHAVTHLPGFTIHASRGHARGHGTDHGFTPDECNPDAHVRLVPIMFCRDAAAAELVDTICRAAHTGNACDGMVAVSGVSELVRIRTGDRGDAAT
ncbi:MAG: P-II family nitrogen regulator [Methylibium sp.]|nr:P-II family nitrogen regulator [Methylibium sp.]MBA3624547.1 P-II family nitrogen regulator [Methylibium sp.]